MEELQYMIQFTIILIIVAIRLLTICEFCRFYGCGHLRLVYMLEILIGAHSCLIFRVNGLKGENFTNNKITDLVYLWESLYNVK